MLLSLAGMTFTLVSFQPKSKKTVLLLQITGNLCYLSSYLFSKGNIAAILNIVYVIRNLVFLLRDTGKRSSLITGGFIAACSASYIFYTLLTNPGLIESLRNLLPIAGAIFGTIAVTKSDLNSFRRWKLGDSLCWLIYNLTIGFGALGGIIGEILNLLSIAIGIFRNQDSKQSPN